MGLCLWICLTRTSILKIPPSLGKARNVRNNFIHCEKARQYRILFEFLAKKKNNEEDDDEMDPEEWAEQMRTFVDEEELLPLKIAGKLVRRMKMAREGQAAADGVEVKEEAMEEEEDQATGNAGNGSQLQGFTVKFVDFNGILALLSVAWQKEEEQHELMMMVQDEQQLQATFTKFLAQAESTVAAAVDAIIVDPRENVKAIY
jgi:hypothetical protein